MIGRGIIVVLAAGILSGMSSAVLALEPPRRPSFDALPAPAPRDAANSKSARMPNATTAAKPASSSKPIPAADASSPSVEAGAAGGKPEAAVAGTATPGTAPANPAVPTAGPASSAAAALPSEAGRAGIDALIARHAQANGIPAGLVHQVVRGESGYNPRAVGRGGAMGLMQIKHATARALGYAGTPAGLLDADTNLSFGVRYLAGAYRTADGNPGRAIGFFRRGYYYDAKRKGTWAGVIAPAAAVQTVELPVEETSSAAPAAPVLDFIDRTTSR